MEAREAAFKAIYHIIEEGKPSHIVLKGILSDLSGDRRDTAFVTRLVEGTVEMMIFLDHCIDFVSKVPVKKQKPVIRTALRLGVYQIMFMDSVPDSAAVNETVKLVRKKGFSGLSGFCNGVLRNISRQKESISKEVSKTPEVRYSCPSWLYEMLVNDYGSETAEEILRGTLRDPDVSVRVNLSRITRDELLKRLQSRGINAFPGNLHDYSVLIADAGDISQYPEFKEGLFQVQDESSMFVAELADIGPDDLVVDVCAAPGGKSLHACDMIKAANGKGRVIARDISEQKTALIQENIARSGFDCIETRVCDACVPDAELFEKADVVICDAPCSGLGIIARKPDVKYNMDPEKMKELQELQRKIIKASVTLLKPGGTFIYSTCTINKGENEENVCWTEKETGLKHVLSKKLLPGIDGCDGFFISKFVKE
ncbi:MAG: 16S rRNA (cytosine(967)-C(5))-methyltransferase RsmB [Lachnospiraceae bacterium]|nr:16S rRNA (cytosine(967)-C(5))-methyltransferase RsmB [Lachnospiraceae bacterium]